MQVEGRYAYLGDALERDMLYCKLYCIHISLRACSRRVQVEGRYAYLGDALERLLTPAPPGVGTRGASVRPGIAQEEPHDGVPAPVGEVAPACER